MFLTLCLSSYCDQGVLERQNRNWHIPKPVEVILTNQSTRIAVEPYTSIIIDSDNKELILHAYEERANSIIPLGIYSSSQIHGVVFGKANGFVRIDTRYYNQSVHLLYCPISDNFQFLFSYQRSVMNFLFEKSWKEVSNGTLEENYTEYINSNIHGKNVGRVRYFKYISMFGDLRPKEKMSYPFLNNNQLGERPSFIIKSKYPIRVMMGYYSDGYIRGEEYTGKELVISSSQVLQKYYLQLYNPFKFNNKVSVLMIRTKYFSLSRKIFTNNQPTSIVDQKTSISLYENANIKTKIPASTLLKDIRFANELNYPKNEHIGKSMFVSTIKPIREKEEEMPKEDKILFPEPYSSGKLSTSNFLEPYDLPLYEIIFEETNILNFSKCGSIIFSKKENQHIRYSSGEEVAFDHQSIGINSGINNNVIHIDSQSNMLFFCTGFRFSSNFFVIQNSIKRSSGSLKISPMHQRTIKDISRRAIKYKLGSGVKRIDIATSYGQIQSLFIGEPYGIIYIENVAGIEAEFYTLDNSGDYIPRYKTLRDIGFIGFHFGSNEGALLIKQKSISQKIKILIFKDPFQNHNTFEIHIKDLIKTNTTSSKAKEKIIFDTQHETTQNNNRDKNSKTQKHQAWPKTSIKPQNVHVIPKTEKRTPKKNRKPHRKSHRPFMETSTFILMLLPLTYFLWQKYRTKQTKKNIMSKSNGSYIMVCARRHSQIPK